MPPKGGAHAVLTGQRARPQRWHQIADGRSADALPSRLRVLRSRVAEKLAELPPHVAFLLRLG